MRRSIPTLAALACLALPLAGAHADTFTSGDSIEIPSADNGSGLALPYPLILAPSNIWGPITDVNVRFNSVTHTNPDDLDILFVRRAPSIGAVILMSDACGTDDVAGFDWEF